MNINRETLQIFDLIFKSLMHLSSKAVINCINGLFSTAYPADSSVEYPITETIEDNLEKIVSDMVLIVNKRDSFHIEVQITNDATIALRMFRYGFAEARRTQLIAPDEHLITLKFPEARIIYWESTKNTPDTVTLRLVFPGEKYFDYEVKTFKFLDHSIDDLEHRNMVLLLPFYVLKVRSALRKAHTVEERRELSDEMQHILNSVFDVIERSRANNVLDDKDMIMILEHMGNLFHQLYDGYEEFKEPRMTLEEKVKPKWQEYLQEGIRAGRLETQLETARNALHAGLTVEVVRTITGLDLETIQSIKES